MKREKRCTACGEKDCKKTGGWNHRVVAEFHQKLKTWVFSIREVYYKKCEIEGWTGQPSDLCTDVDVNDMYEEIQHIERAFTRPLLIVQGEKLVPYGGISAGVKPEQLKQFETTNQP